ncbi:MAG: rhamnogalacturonan lyase [Bacteroidales bacterium]|nr:rhamnogalacturonan lyase [Bacteroidales bacterium]
MERLGRGVIAVLQDKGNVFVTWRYLSVDPFGTAFNVYRDGKKINSSPISDVTFFVDKNSRGGVYSVNPVINGKEKKEHSVAWTLPDKAPHGYIDIELNRPKGGSTPKNEVYTYEPNDCSAADVDGDGEMEIILKWNPTNAHDNAHNGYTGNVYLDCYKLNGKQLWRIDLGKNIRAGAHYTQFMVYDFDGCGKAELICKTADGTIDGTGKAIGDAKKDYRNENGRILEGPEYLTIFNGQTGAAMDTIDYKPSRGANSQEISRIWGDGYGNRCDRFLAGVGYLDGEHPSAIICRGYYTRAVLVAYDWDGKKLKEKWTFDSSQNGNGAYAGQGNHNFYTADVDGDGCDEIIYGSCTIDHDGTGLYSTRLGHGDAMHITQFSLDFPGLQGFFCHENRRDGVTFRDLKTGKIIVHFKGNVDVGRCMAADVDPTSRGVEMWAGCGLGFRDVKGNVLYNIINASDSTSLEGPSNFSVNFAVWWDGDLLRELYDKVQIDKFNWKTGKCDTLVNFDGCMSNNGTKNNPCLLADIFGDWREEVLLRTEDNEHLRLYVSTIPTKYRFHTFLQEPVYRNSLAGQNNCYNQPTHTGFYFGQDLIPNKTGETIYFRGTILKNK